MTDSIQTDIINTVAKSADIPSQDLINIPVIPPLLRTLILDYSQKALTALSVWALASGGSRFISSETSTNLVQFGVGVAGLALSCIWTLVIAYLRKQKMTQLLAFVPSKNVG